MRLFIGILIAFIFPVSLFAVSASDRIEMGVSPIRHEFSVTPGVLMQKSITFYNNSDEPYTLFLTAEECSADSLVGTPKCRKAPNVTGDPLYFSTWVSFPGPTNLVVPPKSEIQVMVNINPPPNAVPGGKYGAVFFNRPTGSTDSNTVKMIQRIGTLFLVTVPGEIRYDIAYGGIWVWPGGGGGGTASITSNTNYPTPKTTPEYWIKHITELLDLTLNAPSLPPVKDFGIDFQIPVKNNGNVHILPVWRIEILDENGLPLKSIGKESIRSPEWAYVWERIVDYLPINDEAGNVLPNSERLYQISWKWFAYETYEWGKAMIKFLSPQDYYKQLQSNESPYLLPWEKYRLIPVSKVLQAKIYLEYSGEKDTPVPFEVTRDITVEYLNLEKSINYGALALLWCILFLIWILFLKWGKQTSHHKKRDNGEYIESEIDELEKWRMLAQKALAKKAEKTPLKVTSTPVIKKTASKTLAPKKQSLPPVAEKKLATPVKKASK